MTVQERIRRSIILVEMKKHKEVSKRLGLNKWWNAHLDLVKRKAVYHMKCQNCERDFDVYGNSHRKYCSHRCYIEYRFGGIGNDERIV